MIGEGAMLAAVHDDLSRPVYGLFGIPVDAATMPSVLQAIDSAALDRSPYLVSTPNLNFLIQSQSDRSFRDSLLQSDLCPADGMPLLWLSRLFGIPIKERVAGSDFFEALKEMPRKRPVRVFLYGGPDGVAEKACAALNRTGSGVVGVGWISPGFGDVASMSSDAIIAEINASNADFLLVSLGAHKGQAWLMHNHDRLTIPVRAHLGAVMNFEAGTVKRAPKRLSRSGLEWLWRIAQEPKLWSRYWSDGTAFLRLLSTRGLPLAAGLGLTRLAAGRPLQATCQDKSRLAVVRLSGSAVERHIEGAILSFRKALASKRSIVVDMADVNVIDPRFTGLLLTVSKAAVGRGVQLVNARRSVRAMLKLNGFSYLLETTAFGSNRVRRPHGRAIEPETLLAGLPAPLATVD
jgi:N-acetylglucosaminyldiphosphoundecaprenol N-acetyl-beta-D-mannosaminyltransferase